MTRWRQHFPPRALSHQVVIMVHPLSISAHPTMHACMRVPVVHPHGRWHTVHRMRTKMIMHVVRRIAVMVKRSWRLLVRQRPFIITKSLCGAKIRRLEVMRVPDMAHLAFHHPICC